MTRRMRRNGEQRVVPFVWVLVWLLLTAFPAEAQNEVKDAAARVEQSIRYMEQTLERHIEATEKQLDVMRESMRSLMEAKLDANNQAYQVWQKILLSVAAAVCGGFVWIFLTSQRTKSIGREMTENMRRVTDAHKDIEGVRNDATTYYRLFQERNAALKHLFREHLARVNEAENEVNHEALRKLLSDVFIVDLLCSGNPGFVSQAVAQVNDQGGSSPMRVVARHVKEPLERLYHGISEELTGKIQTLRVDDF